MTTQSQTNGPSRARTSLPRVFSLVTIDWTHHNANALASRALLLSGMKKMRKLLRTLYQYWEVRGIVLSKPTGSIYFLQYLIMARSKRGSQLERQWKILRSVQLEFSLNMISVAQRLSLPNKFAMTKERSHYVDGTLMTSLKSYLRTSLWTNSRKRISKDSLWERFLAASEKMLIQAWITQKMT